MLNFEEIAFIRRTLAEHFELRLEFDRNNGCHGRMVAPFCPPARRSAADTERAAELYNSLAGIHARAAETK